jgi:hypothetical protein
MDLNSSTPEVSDRLLFDGTARGQDYYGWFAVPDLAVTKQCTNARAAGRQTPDACDQLAIVLGYIKYPSQAYDNLLRIQEISNWRLQAAQDNKYTTSKLTADELAFVLGLSVNVPGKSDSIEKVFETEFGPIAAAAQAKPGWYDAGAAAEADDDGAVAAVAAEADAGQHVVIEVRAASRVLLSKGRKFDPHSYVYRFIMRLYSLKYGQATEDQEAEFNTFQQGALTEEAFASELKRRAAALIHRTDLTERSLLLRFVNGLTDRALAAELLQVLQNATEAVTMDSILLRVAQYKSTLKELTTVRVQAEAAKALQQQRTGFDRALLFKPASNSHTDSSSSSSNAAPKKQFLQAARACVSAGQYPPDHDLAPCMLKGHTSHFNYECRSALHPRNQQGSAAGSSQQPAGAAYMDRYSSFSALPAGAAGMQADFSKGMGAKSQGWRRDGAQPSGGYKPRFGDAGSNSGSGQRCELCHMRNHTVERCFYAHPDRAPPGWKPSKEVRAEAYLHYSQKQTAAQPAGAAAGAGGNRVRWADQNPEQQQQQQGAAGCVLADEVPWYMGGGAVMDSSSIAGGATRKQPHGFWSSDPGPRPSHAADKPVISTNQANTRLTAVPHGVHVQIDLHLPLGKVPDLLALAGTNSSAATQEYRSAPALNQEPDAGMGGEPVGGSAWCNVEPAAAAHSHQHAAAVDTAIMAQLQQHLDLDPDEIRQQLSVYNSECEVQSMYTFIGNTFETGVTVRMNDRDVLIPRPVQDGGCIPNLMTKRFADAVGIHYSPGAPGVKNIEGQPSTMMKWHTQPVRIVLAKGTAGEAVLDVPDGFTVVAGDEAAEMYDVILGRKLLAQVSGCVVPFLRAFMYMPRLQQRDLTMYTLPIKVGHSYRSPALSMIDAAAACDVPRSFWVAGACVQEPEPCPGVPAVETPVPQAAAQQQDTAAAAVQKDIGAGAYKKPADTSTEAVPVQPSSGRICSSKGLMLLLLWPLLWLFGAVDSFYLNIIEPRPYQEDGKIFYRLGRYHRASDGETIRLRCAPGSSGNKPRMIALHRRIFTWRFAVCTLSARTVLLLALIMFMSLSGTAAMQTAGSIGATLHSTALTANLVPPLPFPTLTPSQMLLLGVTEQWGGTFRFPFM